MSSSSSTKVNEDSISSKPEVLKNWKSKLFVLLLCAVSFYAGWQASRSHLVKQCLQAGAKVTVVDSMVICEMP
ncbi:hypothetical protein [Psychrobacter sp.]|uniref:hypothetical protein n=1 Tax=Psychrobacter sp. TaxID=56811 RepID=UPI0025F41C05|nr:hypothetical protein [Psychrobacter sp.]